MGSSLYTSSFIIWLSNATNHFNNNIFRIRPKCKYYFNNIIILSKEEVVLFGIEIV